MIKTTKHINMTHFMNDGPINTMENAKIEWISRLIKSQQNKKFSHT